MARQITTAFWTRVTARHFRTILGTPFSHYTRHAKIPCTMHSPDFSHTTILMREILQYTMESTLLYWKPEMSDETRNE
jgi:hypothetical protein